MTRLNINVPVTGHTNSAKSTKTARYKKTKNLSRKQHPMFKANGSCVCNSVNVCSIYQAAQKTQNAEKNTRKH